MDKKKLLRGCTLFSRISEESLENLADPSHLVSLSKGEDLFLEGDPADAMFLVVEGRVRIFRISAQGKEMVLHFAEQGETFAEAALFEFDSFPANAQSTQACRLLRIPKNPFLSAFDNDAAFRRAVMKSMAIWLRRFSDIIQSLTFKDVESRLASFLLSQCAQGGKQCNDGTRFELGMEKAMLASYLGTIPETLSRALRKMQDNGLISVEKSVIRILDSRALDALVQSDS